ncbi:MAG: ABC transporter ATP-binding protein, partial [Lachnospiraceae bacterium]|nr:ABC transporter ATP-binding protein [Lachnospiraceae bacterium]
MLRTLGAHIKEFKKPSVLTPICMILEVIFEMFIPYLMASIIDEGVNKGDMNHIVLVGLGMIGLAICGLTTGVLGGTFAARASTGFARNLRSAMYDNIQTFSFSNIDKYSTAGLITRLTTDVTNIQNAYQMLLRMCMRAPISLITAMVMAFTISPRLATIYLVAVGILAIILSFIIRFAMKYFTEVFKRYDDLNASVQENVSAIRVVKAYVREDYENKKFGKASYNVYKLFLKAENILALNGPVMMLTVYSCIMLISWFGAHMIVGGSLTTGELTSLLAYCMNILMNLMMLSMIFVMMSMSMPSAKRVAEVLNEKADIVNPENPIMEVKDGSIDFKNVEFAYKNYRRIENERGQETETVEIKEKKPVLKDINLSIKPGETIGILGG